MGVNMKPLELKGQRFGRWLVIKRTMPNAKSGGFRWLCKCDCGVRKVVTGGRLISGNSKSCGCLRNEMATAKQKTHGMCYTPEYGAWEEMFQRCNNPNNKRYHYYGGRGIRICDRWKKFENFYKDMGGKPSKKHSIDRIDNNGDYTPNNCRWATQTEQMRNTRTPKTNTSGARGVRWIERIKKYRAIIGVNYKSVSLGCFSKLQDAIKARQAGELKYWK